MNVDVYAVMVNIWRMEDTEKTDEYIKDIVSHIVSNLPAQVINNIEINKENITRKILIKQKRYIVCGANIEKWKNRRVIDRNLRICYTYYPMKSIDNVLTDVENLKQKIRETLGSYGYDIVQALIPVIHPNFYCRIKKGYGKHNGNKEGKPSDTTRSKIYLYGIVPSEEARKELSLLADKIYEPVSIGKNLFETKREDYTSCRGPIPQIEIHKTWKLLCPQTVNQFYESILNIDRKYGISDRKNSLYPTLTTVAILWRDTINEEGEREYITINYD